jgi:archaellum biogenesis ATPase FlaH
MMNPPQPPPEKEKPRVVATTAASMQHHSRHEDSTLDGTVSVLPLPPHSIDVEQSVLGGLLIDNNAYDKIRDVVTDADFYRDDHRRIFRHVTSLIENNLPADVVTVAGAINASADKDKAGGLTYLATLAGNTPSAHNVRRYAEMVRELSERRAIQAAAMELYDRAARGDLKDCKAELAERVAALAHDPSAIALDLAALGEREPSPPRHIVPAWLPGGEVTLLSGHGGAGKSLLALYLAACIALGRPWAGLATEQRHVLYVSAEDRADVLHWRIERIARCLSIKIADLAGQLEVLDVSAGDAELMSETRDGPVLTALYHGLRTRRPQVLVLDGASDLYGASEIVRPHVRRFVRAVRRLIRADGAALILAHLDKGAARSKETGDRYSGSTAWHNSVRARWELSTTADGLVLTLAKANHAAAGAEIRLRWDAAAHLYLPDSAPAEGGIVGAIRDRQERDGILASMRACATAGLLVPAASQGPRTAYHVLRAQPAFPVDLGADTPPARRRFWRLMEGLRAIGTVSETVMRAPNRHAVAALVLGKEAS